MPYNIKREIRKRIRFKIDCFGERRRLENVMGVTTEKRANNEVNSYDENRVNAIGKVTEK